MKCFRCDKSARDGYTLYRVNEYGVSGIWACKTHIKQTDSKPDEGTQRIVSILEEWGAENHRVGV